MGILLKRRWTERPREGRKVAKVNRGQVIRAREVTGRDITSLTDRTVLTPRLMTRRDTDTARVNTKVREIITEVALTKIITVAAASTDTRAKKIKKAVKVKVLTPRMK